jgi:hypothetical protein
LAVTAALLAAVTAALLAAVTAALTAAVTAALTAAVSESGTLAEDPLPLTAIPVSIPPAPRLAAAGVNDGPRVVVGVARIGTVAGTRERVRARDPAAGGPAGASGSFGAVPAAGPSAWTPRQ